jgi:hypothetical protein
MCDNIIGSEKIAVGSRRAVAKILPWDPSGCGPVLPIENYAMGRLTSSGCTLTGGGEHARLCRNRPQSARLARSSVTQIGSRISGLRVDTDITKSA